MNVEEKTDLTSHPNAYHKWKTWIDDQHPAVRASYKAVIGAVGVSIIIVGLILIPLPGPGWLIVFAGLAFLGLEFPAIQRFNHHLKSRFAKLWNKVKGRKNKKSSSAQ